MSQDVQVLRREYFPERWSWDGLHSSPDVRLSSNKQESYFHLDLENEPSGTAGVRGNKGFSEGEHYWEITMLEPPNTMSVMIGVGTREAVLHMDSSFANLLGQDKRSWGLSHKGILWHGGQSRRYCDIFIDPGTVIGVHLNLYRGTLAYYINDKPLGVAFSGLNTVGEKLYPIISSTPGGTEMSVTLKTCRFLSLEENCYHTIASSLRNRMDIDRLTLPSVMKLHLRELRLS